MLRIILLLLVALSTTCVTPFARAEQNPCVLLKSAVSTTSKLRGLAFKKSVQCTAMHPKQFRDVFQKRIRPQIDMKKISSEGIVYKLLGFIPDDFDFPNCVIESYLAETGSYYREDQNDFVVQHGEPVELSTVVHELTHALQHQHFNLKSFLNTKNESSDSLAAKFALIEGDATNIEQQLAVTEQPLGQTTQANQATQTKRPPKCVLPNQIEELMSFSYDSGPAFIQLLRTNGGIDAVNHAFLFPPQSTSEILHPSRYLDRLKSGVKPARSRIELGATDDSSKIVFSDQMGELFIRTLLGLYIATKQSHEVAANWEDDRLILSRQRDSRHLLQTYLLQWRTNWSSLAGATSFYRTIVEALEKRFSLSELCHRDDSCHLEIVGFGEVAIENQLDSVLLTIKTTLRSR